MDKKSSRRFSILKKVQPTNSAESSPTISKIGRRISFSGKKSIKEFITDDERMTIWGNSYEESAEMLLSQHNVDNTTEQITLNNSKIIPSSIKIHDQENINILEQNGIFREEAEKLVLRNRVVNKAKVLQILKPVKKDIIEADDMEISMCNDSNVEEIKMEYNFPFKNNLDHISEPVLSTNIISESVENQDKAKRKTIIFSNTNNDLDLSTSIVNENINEKNSKFPHVLSTIMSRKRQPLSSPSTLNNIINTNVLYSIPPNKLQRLSALNTLNEEVHRESYNNNERNSTLHNESSFLVTSNLFNKDLGNSFSFNSAEYHIIQDQFKNKENNEEDVNDDSNQSFYSIENDENIDPIKVPVTANNALDLKRNEHLNTDVINSTSNEIIFENKKKTSPNRDSIIRERISLQNDKMFDSKQLENDENIKFEEKSARKTLYFNDEIDVSNTFNISQPVNNKDFNTSITGVIEFVKNTDILEDRSKKQNRNTIFFKNTSQSNINYTVGEKDFEGFDVEESIACGTIYDHNIDLEITANQNISPQVSIKNDDLLNTDKLIDKKRCTILFGNTILESTQPNLEIQPNSINDEKFCEFKSSEIKNRRTIYNQEIELDESVMERETIFQHNMDITLNDEHKNSSEKLGNYQQKISTISFDVTQSKLQIESSIFNQENNNISNKETINKFKPQNHETIFEQDIDFDKSVKCVSNKQNISNKRCTIFQGSMDITVNDDDIQYEGKHNDQLKSNDGLVMCTNDIKRNKIKQQKRGTVIFNNEILEVTQCNGESLKQSQIKEQLYDFPKLSLNKLRSDHRETIFGEDMELNNSIKDIIVNPNLSNKRGTVFERNMDITVADENIKGEAFNPTFNELGSNKADEQSNVNNECKISEPQQNPISVNDNVLGSCHHQTVFDEDIVLDNSIKCVSVKQNENKKRKTNFDHNTDITVDDENVEYENKTLKQSFSKKSWAKQVNQNSVIPQDDGKRIENISKQQNHDKKLFTVLKQSIVEPEPTIINKENLYNKENINNLKSQNNETIFEHNIELDRSIKFMPVIQSLSKKRGTIFENNMDITVNKENIEYEVKPVTATLIEHVSIKSDDLLNYSDKMGISDNDGMLNEKQFKQQNYDVALLTNNTQSILELKQKMLKEETVFDKNIVLDKSSKGVIPKKITMKRGTIFQHSMDVIDNNDIGEYSKQNLKSQNRQTIYDEDIVLDKSVKFTAKHNLSKKRGTIFEHNMDITVNHESIKYEDKLLKHTHIEHVSINPDDLLNSYEELRSFDRTGMLNKNQLKQNRDLSSITNTPSSILELNPKISNEIKIENHEVDVQPRMDIIDSTDISELKTTPNFSDNNLKKSNNQLHINSEKAEDKIVYENEFKQQKRGTILFNNGIFDATLSKSTCLSQQNFSRPRNRQTIFELDIEPDKSMHNIILSKQNRIKKRETIYDTNMDITENMEFKDKSLIQTFTEQKLDTNVPLINNNEINENSKLKKSSQKRGTMFFDHNIIDESQFHEELKKLHDSPDKKNPNILKSRQTVFEQDIDLDNSIKGGLGNKKVFSMRRTVFERNDMDITANDEAIELDKSKRGSSLKPNMSKKRATVYENNMEITVSEELNPASHNCAELNTSEEVINKNDFRKPKVTKLTQTLNLTTPNIHSSDKSFDKNDVTINDNTSIIRTEQYSKEIKNLPILHMENDNDDRVDYGDKIHLSRKGSKILEFNIPSGHMNSIIKSDPNNIKSAFLKGCDPEDDLQEEDELMEQFNNTRSLTARGLLIDEDCDEDFKINNENISKPHKYKNFPDISFDAKSKIEAHNLSNLNKICMNLIRKKTKHDLDQISLIDKTEKLSVAEPKSDKNILYGDQSMEIDVNLDPVEINSNPRRQENIIFGQEKNLETIIFEKNKNISNLSKIIQPDKSVQANVSVNKSMDMLINNKQLKTFGDMITSAEIEHVSTGKIRNIISDKENQNCSFPVENLETYETSVLGLFGTDSSGSINSTETLCNLDPKNMCDAINLSNSVEKNQIANYVSSNSFIVLKIPTTKSMIPVATKFNSSSIKSIEQNEIKISENLSKNVCNTDLRIKSLLNQTLGENNSIEYDKIDQTSFNLVNSFQSFRDDEPKQEFDHKIKYIETDSSNIFKPIDVNNMKPRKSKRIIPVINYDGYKQFANMPRFSDLVDKLQYSLKNTNRISDVSGPVEGPITPSVKFLANNYKEMVMERLREKSVQKEYYIKPIYPLTPELPFLIKNKLSEKHKFWSMNDNYYLNGKLSFVHPKIKAAEIIMLFNTDNLNLFGDTQFDSVIAKISATNVIPSTPDLIRHLEFFNIVPLEMKYDCPTSSEIFQFLEKLEENVINKIASDVDILMNILKLSNSNLSHEEKSGECILRKTLFLMSKRKMYFIKIKLNDFKNVGLADLSVEPKVELNSCALNLGKGLEFLREILTNTQKYFKI